MGHHHPTPQQPTNHPNPKLLSMKEAFKKEKSKSDFSEFREKKFQVDSKRENIIRSSMSKENIIKEKF